MNGLTGYRTRRIACAALTICITLSLAATSRAAAQIEVESDPFAWVLSGFSLHGAAALGPVRLSVGTFGVDVPEFFHGNDDWDVVVRGGTVKLDWVGSSTDGLFAGLDGQYARTRYTYTPETGEPRVNRDGVGLGVRGGYRLPLGGSGLFVVPWMSVSYSLDGRDVTVAAETFDRGRVTVFPTVHVGWRF